MRRIRPFAGALVALLLTTGSGRAEVWPLEITDGRCDAVLDTSHAADQYLLVVGSLATWNHIGTVRLRAEPTSAACHLPILPPCNHEIAKEALRRRAWALAKDRASGLVEETFPPLAAPPARKTFYLFAGERDLENRERYRAVEARLHSFNRVCQVYVDALDGKACDATAAEVLRAFQEDVLLWSTKHLGCAVDVDRDGRFTIFLTSAIELLAKSTAPPRGGSSGRRGPGPQLDGFMRGSDFFIDLPPPFSNRCDMLTLSSRLVPGPRLRTILAHEFAHAVTFCGHALSRYPSGPRHQDEETWLSESIAHRVEEVRGFSRCNIDHRVRAYLNDSTSCPLVVPDTFAAGLWRTPGIRGGGLLLLRELHLRQGGDFLFRLAQSNLRGVDNLAVATGEPFDETFRRFGVELAQNGWRLKPSGTGDTREAWPHAWVGPRPRELVMADGAEELRLPGTGLGIVHLHTPAAARTRLTIDIGKMPVQLTLLRLERRPRLEIRCRREADGHVAVEVRSHHGEIVLRRASAESVEPASCSEHSGDLPHGLMGEPLRPGRAVRWRQSAAATDTVVRVEGSDATGNLIVAWTVAGD